jgi:hypothetical protein
LKNLPPGRRRDGMFLEKFFFAVDQGINVVGGEFESVPVCNRVRGAGFHAVPAENTARIIYVVNAGIALTRGDPVRVCVFRGFDVNAIGGASCGTEETAYALLQARFVAMQHMNPAVARLEVYWFEGIILRDRFTKHITKGHAESLNQGGKRLANFTQDGCHKLGV